MFLRRAYLFYSNPLVEEHMMELGDIVQLSDDELEDVSFNYQSIGVVISSGSMIKVLWNDGSTSDFRENEPILYLKVIG